MTATVVSPSPSSALPSRHEASSPVTSTHGAVPVPAERRVDPGLADLDAVEPQAPPRRAAHRVREHAVARACHRVHADEERSVDALLEVLDVLRPLVLDDVLAVGVELLGDQRVERPPLAGAVTVHHDDLRRPGSLRAAHGRVDLARVEAAPFLVHRVAACHLLPLHDAGDAFHVADDEDLHAKIAPTISPTTVRAPEPPGTRRSRARRRARAGSPRYAPSSAFSAKPRPSSCAAQNRPSAPPFAIQPSRSAHQIGVGRAARRADELGPRAHRRCGSAPGVRVSSAAASLERRRERRHAAAVDRHARRRRRARRSAAAADARGRGTGGAASRARGRPRASRRACPSSCARASRPAGPPAGPFSRSSTVAPARASTLRTAASCAGSAWCDAQAIAISSSSRSS